jgi:hypothetical protein
MNGLKLGCNDSGIVVTFRAHGPEVGTLPRARTRPAAQFTRQNAARLEPGPARALLFNTGLLSVGDLTVVGGVAGADGAWSLSG